MLALGEVLVVGILRYKIRPNSSLNRIMNLTLISENIPLMKTCDKHRIRHSKNACL